MRLKDEIAIVVGAGQSPGEGLGNGRATVLRLAQEGATLAVDGDLLPPRKRSQWRDKMVPNVLRSKQTLPTSPLLQRRSRLHGDVGDASMCSTTMSA